MMSYSINSTAIVVGCGLAGLSVALELLRNNIPVTILEKGDNWGGNSIKASSGINGAVTKQQFKNDITNDSVEQFYNDSFLSGKGQSDKKLLSVLTKNSAAAIEWLTDEDLNIDLLLVSKLGGHTVARTHRGSGKIPPGYAIISAISAKLQQFTENTNGPTLTVLKTATLKKLITSDSNSVVGIEYEKGGVRDVLHGSHVILATGGYSADSNSADSLIKTYRPDLLDYPLTNSILTEGDGQKVAARDVNAGLLNMDDIQIHPTGFINCLTSTASTEDINGKWKFLCGEVLRGVGGILLSPVGDRFVNELTTRDKITEAVDASCAISPANKYGIKRNSKVSMIVLNSNDYLKTQNHIDFYVFKGLMQKVRMDELIAILNKLSGQNKSEIESNVQKTFESLNQAIHGDTVDEHGRTSFGTEFPVLKDSDYYVGLVTPVVHFCMGGIKINENAQVIDRTGSIVPNLYAVGEITGGVHGKNRLGGNSLLECVVFARQAASHISEN